MKKYLFVLQVGFVFLLVLCSGCKSRIVINPPESIYFQVIKFTKPEYANYVTATIVNGLGMKRE